MPGAGHIVHMPAHVYLRVGRYEEAARANIAAVEADHRYLAAGEAKAGFYPLFYAPHNVHFLWSAYLLSGQRDEGAAGVAGARGARRRGGCPGERGAPGLPAGRRPDARALRRLGGRARQPGAAGRSASTSAACGTTRAASRSQRGTTSAPPATSSTRVRTIAGEVKEDVIIILNTAPVAAEACRRGAGRRHRRRGGARRRGDRPPATGGGPRGRAHLRRAAAVVPLGASHAGPRPARRRTARSRPKRRSATICASLRETGWSLRGLELALRAQGNVREAEDVARRRQEAWKYADVSADVSPVGDPGRRPTAEP